LDEPNAALRRFIEEEDPAIAQRYLGELIVQHIDPIVREITRFKARSYNTWIPTRKPLDEEDIRSEARLQLISRLKDLRTSGKTTLIDNFRGYVAVTTYNTFHKHIRNEHPAWWRLKNRIRYLLNHRPSFVLWKNEKNEYLCGLANWPSDRRQNLTNSDSPRRGAAEFLSSLPLEITVDRSNLEELVKRFLVWRGYVIILDELVGVVADLQGIKDWQQVQLHADTEGDGNGMSVCELLPSLGSDVATSLEERSHLEHLWHEIRQLPRPQQVALLLNLRDAQSSDALILFVFMGIASLKEIAQTMELPLDDFARLWNSLPLQDAVIANLLGVTRQQVINLRKSARERLARRMAAS
jgi:hypothetical protein